MFASLAIAEKGPAAGVHRAVGVSRYGAAGTRFDASRLADTITAPYEPVQTTFLRWPSGLRLRHFPINFHASTSPCTELALGKRLCPSGKPRAPGGMRRRCGAGLVANKRHYRKVFSERGRWRTAPAPRRSWRGASAHASSNETSRSTRWAEQRQRRSWALQSCDSCERMKQCNQAK